MQGKNQNSNLSTKNYKLPKREQWCGSQPMVNPSVKVDRIKVIFFLPKTSFNIKPLSCCCLLIMIKMMATGSNLAFCTVAAPL